MSARPTFTAWKRLLRVGVEIKVTGLTPEHKVLDSEARPITKLKSNAMATRYVRPNGEVVEHCWIYWPATSSVHVVDDNTIELSDPISGVRWVRYEVVS